MDPQKATLMVGTKLVRSGSVQFGQFNYTLA